MKIKNRFYPRTKGHLFVCTDREKLYDLYIKQRMSTEKCAEILNCSQGTIMKRLEEFNISIRNLSESHKGNIPWNKGKKGEGMVNYGKHFTKKHKEKIGISHLGIGHTEKTREKLSIIGKGQHRSPRTEFKKGDNLGAKNSSWKGGITPLVMKVRNSFKYRQWRSDIFFRDDFTCQKCDKRGGCLHAHHKKTLSDIMELNDIRTYKQALECSELWDINNGITYCKKCHNSIKRKVS